MSDPVRDASPTSPHAREVADLARELGVDPALGLAAADARERAAAAGPNAARGRPSRTDLEDAARGGDRAVRAPARRGRRPGGPRRRGPRRPAGPRRSAARSSGADVVTEYRGERALEALRDASAPVARVRRDGGRRERPGRASWSPATSCSSRRGDVVPADLRLVRVDRLLVDRSVLTGESVPEAAPHRAPTRRTRRSPTGARSPTPGTSVVGGRGEGIVVAIGRGDRVRPDRRRPGHARAAAVAAPARARPAGPDPARRRDRADRRHERARVPARPPARRRTSSPASRRRSPRSPRSRRSSWP